MHLDPPIMTMITTVHDVMMLLALTELYAFAQFTGVIWLTVVSAQGHQIVIPRLFLGYHQAIVVGINSETKDDNGDPTH